VKEMKVVLSLKSLILGILVLVSCVGNMNLAYADRVDELIEQLKDEDWRVREAAAKALGKIGNIRAVEPLSAALRDKDEDVRESAASALEKINPNWHTTEEAKRQVPQFIAALRDEYWYVRKAAAYALGEIGDRWAINALKEVAEKDEVEEVKVIAKEALEKIEKRIKGGQR
jgi:HEAT repeat protein